MTRSERWRLILGRAAEGDLPLGNAALRPVDEGLSYLYEPGEKGATLDPSRPYLPKDLLEWLEKIREWFPIETVALLERDAIDRGRMTLEPEILERTEPTLDFVRFLLAAKERIPNRGKEIARRIVREVVEEIRRTMEIQVCSTIQGALRRDRHSPLRLTRNIDWKRTLDRNLKNWDPKRRILVPERFHFWARERRRREWNVILLVDQSASMGESVVTSAIFASILASLDALRTHLVLFGSEVVDVSPHLSDPVEILLGARLGGGTDLSRAIQYGASLVKVPERTLLVLVSDLCDGGDRERSIHGLRALVERGVRVLSLLAFTDDGREAYDSEMARRVAELGIVAFGGTPRKLVEKMEEILGRRSQ